MDAIKHCLIPSFLRSGQVMKVPKPKSLSHKLETQISLGKICDSDVLKHS